MHIGERIKARREELGWTQDQLAKRMGYTSRSTVQKVEKGINDITQSTVMLYAEVLGVTPSWLMGWEQEEIENVEKDKLCSIFAQMNNEQRDRLLEYANFVLFQTRDK